MLVIFDTSKERLNANIKCWIMSKEYRVVRYFMVIPNIPCVNAIQSTKRELSAKSITIKRTSLISVITYWYMVMKNLVVKLIELNDYEKRRYRSNGRYISRI